MADSLLNGHTLRPSTITVAIDPVALVVTECITVTSAMRKHARWAHSSISSILGSSASTSTTTTTSRPSTPDSRGPSSERSRASSKIDLIEDDGSLTSRWGLRGKKGQSMQDNPLMSAFARLRADLKACRDIQEFDTPSLLQPFLQVIRSSSTTAPITSLALIAITKMLAYNIINLRSPGFGHGMQLLASTVTNCRFEGDNSPSDEVVFLRILKLMEDMICGPSGDVLGDASVCEMMTCALSICCHLRMSEVLRRSAEISMVTMCQVIFTRLKALENEVEANGQLEDDVKQEDMDAAKIDSNPDGEHGPTAMQALAKTSLEVPGISTERASVDGNASQLDLSKQTDGDEVKEVRPYGLPSIRELFRVLADLLDPHDRARTDTLRVMALRIVNVALEVAGPSIANHPSLASLAKDTLCRNLFQLVRSENIAILHESLRVAGTLLATCRSVLKLQQELFLSYVIACLHPRVPIPDEPNIDPSIYAGIPQAPALVKQTPPAGAAPGSGRNTPVPVRDRQKLGLEGGSRKPDAREAMVESIGALVRIPSLMVELFVNYDCEIDRSDLCSDMVGLLARNAFPDSATWSTTNVPPLCLDSLLGYVQQIAERLEDEERQPTGSEGLLPAAETLRKQRDLKKVIIRGATKFNESPKAGIAFLASQGVIRDPNDPQSVTGFLKGTTRIDKRVLGDFIAKKGNEAILEAFMGQFNFSGQRVDEALRQVLNTFRLPGESALIERIVTVFSEKYMDAVKTTEVADTDALFVLTYAIIMLNTDQYNANVKPGARMKVEDFAKNLRGVNAGKDFGKEYLQAIYDAIKTREIVLPEEHDNRHAFEHAWKELLVKTQTAEDQVICEGSKAYDADMFAATWRPIVATLNYVFVSATEDAVFHRVIAGYNQVAQIAATYGISECLDRVIESLARMSTLASRVPPDIGLNTEVQAGGKSIMVSKFAVDFGRDNKAELATVVLFKIINGHEGAVREGWTDIIRIIVNLFINSLVPTSFTSISRDLDLPPIPLQSPAQVIERNDKAAEVGLFSAFTSYVSSVMNDEPPEPNDQEIEATLTTVDCINACRFEEILGNVSELSVESLKSLTTALLSQLPEQDSPPYLTVKSEMPAPTPIRANGTTTKPLPTVQDTQHPIYNPAAVYVLELSTILALRDEETITALGASVAEALQAVVRDADRLHPVALSRTVFYLLALLRASNDHKYIRTPVVLHAISAFRPDVLRACAQPILKGMLGCISGPAELKSEMACSPDFWAVLHALVAVEEGAGLVFQIVEEVVRDGSGGSGGSVVSGDNYEACVGLLNQFATAGSVGARQEQSRDSKGRPQQRGQAKEEGQQGEKGKPKKLEAVVRGTRALTLVSQLASRVPALIEQSHLEMNEAWRAYWSPVFRCLATQCVNPCRGIRQQAFTSLQRCLLSSELASPDHTEWTNIFSEVLSPLINQLLKPEVYQTDPLGMTETRVQAAQLLCKIFLHYLVLLSEWEGMLDLWIRIMGIMDRLMNSGQNDMLVEAIPESLKNILLVMSSDEHLMPPPTSEEDEDERSEQQVELWTETWTRLERFLPGLLPELFPKAGKEARVNQLPSATAEKSLVPDSKDDDASSTVSSQPASSVAAEPQAA
ncbi:GDP/GTP exchange factor for ARF [Recurvomyces mirabilis]|uniref:GDP/GTP exchange factor for ARF n=1 Tax=Recurvomyces mirabilis TaxID=574656 RepID=A0AAE0WU98_9PEZI|nr:GDP/GTP exchange factor for ARF [Recurvomyces mirabilis]KAK5160500.1 GDP/GTP exchange factor for ARF [Recurvomyces mirabilis]